MGGVAWEIIGAVDLTIGGIFLTTGVGMPIMLVYVFRRHIKLTDRGTV
jgi:hypothetical protein